MKTEYYNIPDINEKEVYSVGEQIAYINIKKTVGGLSSNYNVIQESYNENEKLLMKQIEVYNPNIIIFGNTLNFFNKSKLKEIGWDIQGCEMEYADNNTKNTNCYFVSPDRLCIHAYHPSYWVLSNKTYCSEIIEGAIKWKNKLDFCE